MIINTNMQSINAHRQIGVNQSNASKSMEKLSSGLRINRAGDDAAGLAISEKMRGQIRGLDQASRNAQDGISLIQTAEGALNETHSILQRMRELGVQSSNDTNTDSDRAELQKEINQLTDEINRISETTEFNTQKLLQGDSKQTIEGTGKVTVAPTPGTDQTQTNAEMKFTATGTPGAIELEINGQTVKVATTTTDAAKNAEELAKGLQEAIDSNSALKGQYEVSVSGNDVTLKAVEGGKFEGAAGTIKAVSGNASTGVADATEVKGTTTAATAAKSTVTFGAIADPTELVGKGLTIGDKTIEFYDASKGAYEGDSIGIDISKVADQDGLAQVIVDQIGDKIDGVKLSVNGTDLVVESTTAGANGSVNFADGGKSENYTVNLQVGANAGQTMSIEIGDMSAKALGVNGIDVSSAKGAEAAIKSVDEAISKVSAQRSQLGAFQNRLEHTINNLGTSSENLTAAESRIRDVDMAKEMMEMSKNNILSQAAQAMLTQANQNPQQVLQLLR